MDRVIPGQKQEYRKLREPKDGLGLLKWTDRWNGWKQLELLRCILETETELEWKSEDKTRAIYQTFATMCCCSQSLNYGAVDKSHLIKHVL